MEGREEEGADRWRGRRKDGAAAEGSGSGERSGGGEGSGSGSRACERERLQWVGWTDGWMDGWMDGCLPRHRSMPQRIPPIRIQLIFLLLFLFSYLGQTFNILTTYS